MAVAERTGTETYSAEILSHLAPLIGDDRLVVYLNGVALPNDLDLPSSIDLRPIPFRRLWTHLRLSWEMGRHPPDVLFVPAHVVPLRHPASVVTIHDLGYLVEPDAHPPGDRRRLDLTTRWSVKAARRVIAVSEATKRAMVGAYRVRPERVRVIHHGVSPRFRRADPPDVSKVATRYRLPRHYVLTVGTIQPRKNLPRLVAALGRARAAGLDHELVVVGRPGWLADRVEAEISATGASELVHRLGYVPLEDLPALYTGADAFALPSLYEGFGMPALEALACGVPTLVSDRGALPEVVADAAVLVDAGSVEAIGDRLIRLLCDEPLRRELHERGPIRAAGFGWNSAAEKTLSVLREAAAEAKNRSSFEAAIHHGRHTSDRDGDG